MINEIKFSTNWNNKLHCQVFTTIRRSACYTKGSVWTVVAPKIEPFEVMVLDVKILTKPQMNEWIARLDTGYSLDELLEILFKMYPDAHLKTPFYFILLARVNPKS